jgi:1-acyl-sn-glycerol-3-phosphate acyltransferase
MSLRDLYYFPLYYLTLVLFALGGLELSLLGFLAGLLPANDRTERFFQRLIHSHFAAFHGWCAFTGLVRVRHHGFESIPAGGLVIAANHPSLIDITCILARVREAVCIFKPAIRRNPVLGAAARRAGYLGNDGGHDLVRAAADKVSAGNKLVVFPEGTRTPRGETLLPFKPGFVLIARRARVPIQLLRITASSRILDKGSPWWRFPELPVVVEIATGPIITVELDADAASVVADIEEWYRTAVRDPNFEREVALS